MSVQSVKGHVIPVLLVSVVAGCGGGGGGGGSGMPDTASLTAFSNAVSFSTTENDTFRPRQTVFFSIDNPPEGGFFLSAYQTTGASELGTLKKVPQTFATYQVEIEFLPGSELIPGFHKETLEFHACLDKACNDEIANSPQTVEFTYTVKPLGAGVLGRNELLVDTVGIDAQDLVWDASRNVMYASTSSRSPIAPNSVVTLDPVTGAVLSATFAGSEPDALALADDGSLLYVGFNGANEFKRYVLPQMTLDLAVRLEPNPLKLGPEKALEMAVAPGAPHTVAVSRGSLGPGLGSRGVTLYDDGTPRPLTTQVGSGIITTTIQWGDDASMLYGGDSESSALGLYRMTVGASGITSTQEFGSEVGGGRRIHYADGHIYHDNGRIIDLAAHRMTALPDVVTRVIPDPSLNRVFALGSGSVLSLSSYDLTTRALVGSIALPGILGDPRRLIRWGDDGLAFSTNENELVLARGAHIDGPAPDTALFLSPYSIAVSAAAGSTEVPTAKLHALTTLPLSEGTHFEFDHTDNGIANITTVEGPQQHTLRLNIAFKAPDSLAPGTYRDTIEVRACRDAACAQPLPGSPKVAQVSYAVTSARTVSTVNVIARDLQYDSQAGRIYVSTTAGSPTYPASLAVVDPLTGDVTLCLEGGAPDPLALSPDGQYLYAGMDVSGTIQRFVLPGLVPDLQIGLGTEAYPGPYKATHLAVAPGDSAAVAAILSGANGPEALALFDGAAVRPDRVLLRDEQNFDNFDLVGSLAWDPSGSRLYGGNHRLSVLAVDADGVSVELRHQRDRVSQRIQLVDGRLYSSSGRVYDPLTGDVLGTFPGKGQFVVDGQLNRAFFVGFGLDLGGSIGTTIVESYDLSTFLPLGNVVLPTTFTRRMVRWGDDGLAIARSSDELVTISGPFVAPTP